MNRRTQNVLITGIDFTSAPSPSKPLTVAHGQLNGRRLSLIKPLKNLYNFAAFQKLLQQPGPRVTAIDFPFGQPSRFVQAVGWSPRWEDYVQEAQQLGKAGFVELLQDYKARQPPGDKEHQRATDVCAGSLSPMKTHGVPLAKMFVEGAPRIERSPCSVLPCRPNGCDSLVLEAYPGRVARWAIGRRPYKTETKSKDTSAMRDARRDLIAAVLSGRLPKQYGVSVDLDDEVREELGDDFKGDRLDALLCAIQAAWAVSNKSFGIPQNAHIEEGWIVDPHCVET